MLHWEIIVIKTSWKLECFHILKAQRTAWKHPESHGWVMYVMGVFIFSYLSFFFLHPQWHNRGTPSHPVLPNLRDAGQWCLYCPVWGRVLLQHPQFRVLRDNSGEVWSMAHHMLVSPVSCMGCSCHLCQERRWQRMGEGAELCPVWSQGQHWITRPLF